MTGRTDNGRSDMLNRIRKNIQSNYTYCDIIYKPTAKQIAFLDDKIKLLDISEITKIVLEKIENIKNPSLDEILEADKKARELAKEEISKKMVNNELS